MSKSMKYAGNYNLKGKKYKIARCGCWCIQDFRDKYKKKIDIKEMSVYNKS